MQPGWTWQQPSSDVAMINGHEAVPWWHSWYVEGLEKRAPPGRMEPVAVSSLLKLAWPSPVLLSQDPRKATINSMVAAHTFER